MTTIDMTKDYRPEYVSVVTLKGHIKMMKLGMKHSRMRNGDAMRKARELTGASFGLRDYDAAIKALEARRDALLVYIEQGS